MNSLSIKEYPSSDRPMEKMERLGPAALSDEELLAILIGSGTKEYNALELASQLLHTNRERTWLLKASLNELQEIPGIGLSKSCRIVAGLQLGQRLMEERSFQSISLTSPRTVANYFRSVYQGEDRELFCVILLDTKNHPIKMQLISIGSLNQTIVHPREVFREAIRQGANGMILSHNHPSGDPEPSPEDISITKRLVAAGEVVGIAVLDHVIVGDASYVSFRERDLL